MGFSFDQNGKIVHRASSLSEKGWVWANLC